MMFEINGAEVEAEFSAWTAMLYEQEFEGADIVADINGRLRASRDEADDSLLFDLSGIPNTSILKAAWAMVKTANDKTPHFPKWAKDVREVNMASLSLDVVTAIGDGFFHTAPTDGEEDGGGTR